jgi:hypothetical protein
MCAQGKGHQFFDSSSSRWKSARNGLDEINAHKRYAKACRDDVDGWKETRGGEPDASEEPASWIQNGVLLACSNLPTTMAIIETTRPT